MDTYGYVRVSTKEQNEDRQIIAMREFGVEDRHIMLDKQSGKDFERPGYQRLIRELKAGDTLVIKSIDRLGRPAGTVYLVTDSGVYRCDIFAAFEASVQCMIYQPDLADQEDEFIQFCLDSSEINTGIVPQPGDRILTLSTCTGSGHAKRWVVQGILVEIA